MSVLISREAAIEAIDKNRQDLLSLGMDGAEHILVHYGRRVIEELPTAEVTLCHLDSPCEYQNADIAMPSAQQWIPVNERLPEEGKQVLVCDDGGFIYTAEGETRSDGEWQWYESVEYRPMEDVVAWMLLPEPYKGEDGEEG